jgi:alpha-beta hydrolase superfamily lysophospholipase
VEVDILAGLSRPRRKRAGCDDAGVARGRVVTAEPPDQAGIRDGLAYALFVPRDEVRGGIVILHGAGSCKESHYDYARHARRLGLAAAAFDLRGHGDSEGTLDGRVGEDVLVVAGLLPDGPLALRGSSLGGYLALTCASEVGASAVVAICPAGADGLRRGVRNGRFDARIDAAGFDAYLRSHDETAATETLSAALLLLHAEGDEVVPVEHSRALYEAAGGGQAGASAMRRLIAVPGGHHRSVQHDPELQAVSLRFVARAFAAAEASPGA